MNKKGYLTLILAFLLLLVAGCSTESQKKVQSEDIQFKTLYKGDLAEVNKIVIQSRLENKSKVIKNPVEVKNWLTRLENVHFHKDQNQEPRSGDSMTITFMHDNRELFVFSPTRIDGNYYTPKESLRDLLLPTE